MTDGRRRLGPSIRDWLVLAIGVLFTAMGLIVAIGRHDRTGVGVVVFFGGCAAVALWTIFRKLRIKAHYAAARVDVPRGVPIRAGRSFGLGWSGGAAVMGAVMAATGAPIGTVYIVLSGVIGVIGAALFFVLLAGIFPRPALQFEAVGLRFTQRGYGFLLEWNNIASLAPGETHGHDLLLISVRDPDRLAATVEGDRADRNPVAKLVRSNRAWFGADIVVMAVQYGLDVALLAHAIKGYVTAAHADDQSPSPLTPAPAIERPPTT